MSWSLFTISTNIIDKKFDNKVVIENNKSKLIFTKEKDLIVFSEIDDVNENMPSQLFDDGRTSLKYKKGPMGIDGLLAKDGIRCFKIN